MRFVAVLFSATVILLVVRIVQIAGRLEAPPAKPSAVAAEHRLEAPVAELNEWFHRKWEAEGVRPAEPVDDLTVFRRLNLALFGTVPSLEDLRVFEADTDPDRIDRWVTRMLQDSRYSDYFAERLARSLVGVELPAGSADGLVVRTAAGGCCLVRDDPGTDRR
jgi:Protein of unknown function (DUF1549)